MTNERHKLAIIIANKKKLKEILHIAAVCGCRLKCAENPFLVPLLECAFMGRFSFDLKAIYTFCKLVTYSF